MSGPWEKYQSSEGPWTKYGGGATAAPAATPDEPADTRSAGRKFFDTVRAPSESLTSLATGMIAGPVSDVAGLAATGYEALAHGAHGEGDMPSKFRDYVRDQLTYSPSSPEAQSAHRTLGQIAAPIGKIGGNVADAVRGPGPANSPRVMAANAAIEGVKQAPGFLGVKGVPKVAGAIERGTDTLMGGTARAARSEAMTATRGALQDTESRLGEQAAAKHGEAADAFAQARAARQEALNTQRTLDAAKQRGVPTSDALGGQVRDEYSRIMAEADAARKKATEPLYAKAKAAAAAREAQGQFVDVKPALKELDEMIEQSENIPDLRTKLLQLRESVQGTAPKPPVEAPVGKGRVTSKMSAPPTPAPPAQPLSYAQLDIALRRTKDIAFSGEAEGYGALIRNTAKRLSVKLDQQIAKTVPEHAEAAAAYRKLSEPMETLTTRYGQAIRDTEGGLKDEAYSKIPAQDLPRRIFSKREGVEQLIDALAGGKDAPPAARAAAQAKVDTWVENWILDQTTGKVGKKAADAIAVPGMRPTLNAVPGAAGRLSARFGREAAAEDRVASLTDRAGAARKTAASARADAATLAKQRVAVRSQIEQADIDLAHGSQKVAYDAYVSALRKSMGSSDPEKYRAAIALIERAGALEAKTEKARSLAKKFVYGAAAFGAGVEAHRVLQ